MGAVPPFSPLDSAMVLDPTALCSGHGDLGNRGGLPTGHPRLRPAGREERPPEPHAWKLKIVYTSQFVRWQTAEPSAAPGSKGGAGAAAALTWVVEWQGDQRREQVPQGGGLGHTGAGR